MRSILPTYRSYKDFPAFRQGNFKTYIFAQFDRKIPSFLRAEAFVENITVLSATLISLNYYSLMTFKTYEVLEEVNVDLVNIGSRQGPNFYQVYGKPNAILLDKNKVYTIKIELSNNTEFYTNMFAYCSKNQETDGFLWNVNNNSDFLINSDNTNIIIQ